MIMQLDYFGKLENIFLKVSGFKEVKCIIVEFRSSKFPFTIIRNSTKKPVKPAGSTHPYV
jgi:hypothetical protein